MKTSARPLIKCIASASAAAAAFILVEVLTGLVPKASAVPSFARQTGQPCGTCHTDFPALTPFGRRFKVLGYTTGGGMYRTTPFSSSPAANAQRSDADKLRDYANAVESKANGLSNQTSGTYVPPIALMGIVGYTHTQAPLPPPTNPYGPNDNTVFSPFSVFWGGAITDRMGAFAQLTYNAPPPGGFSDPFGHTWTWDNTDIRFANIANIGGNSVIYGITANNNPTVQDLWNTTPAWGFPYAASTLAPTPGAGTMLEGAFAAHVGSVGAYALINDLLYLELSGYRTLPFGTQNRLGTDPFDAPGMLGATAPYWRLALEPRWGRNTLMIGTFGAYFNVHPWVDPSFATGTTATLPQSDKYTDIGIDAQYQYQGDNYWLTLRSSYIYEQQRLDASSLSGTNLTNRLNSFRAQASLAYGSDNRIVLTGQYFDIWGTSDPVAYSGLASTFSPNSSGFTAEIAYIPFSASRAPLWPWANARIGLQYTWYSKFDGTSIGAHNNNTLFLHAWFAM